MATVRLRPARFTIVLDDTVEIGPGSGAMSRHSLFMLLIGQFVNGVTDVYMLSEAFIPRLKVCHYSHSTDLKVLK